MPLLPPRITMASMRAAEYWKKDVAEFGHSRTKETTYNMIRRLRGDAAQLQRASRV